MKNHEPNISDLNPAPKESFLTEEDFVKVPGDLSEYRFGGAIQRENFIDYLIKSYSLSRGESLLQLALFDLLKKKTGFDSFKTNEAFIKSGGWRILSNKEREVFLEFFRKVGMHSKFRKSVTEEDLVISLELKRLNEKPDAEKYKIAQSYFKKIDEINSFSDFSRIAEVYLKNQKPKPFINNPDYKNMVLFIDQKHSPSLLRRELKRIINKYENIFPQNLKSQMIVWEANIPDRAIPDEKAIVSMKGTLNDFWEIISKNPMIAEEISFPDTSRTHRGEDF